MEIKYGDKGEKVRNLQIALNNLGYTLAIDGIFGNETLQAVKQAQIISGLEPNGIITDENLFRISKEISQIYTEKNNYLPLILGFGIAVIGISLLSKLKTA